MDPLVQKCRRRLAELKHERRSWDSHWKDLRDHVFPWAGDFLSDGERPNDGSKRKDPVESVGREALQVLAAGMHSGLTPRSERWFGLAAQYPAGKSDGCTELWLDRCTTLILDILAASNFYHAVMQMYEDLGLFGTSVLYVEPDFDTVLSFRHLSVGGYCLACNARGQADTLFREFRMTARNVVKEFGAQNCSERVQRLAVEAPETWVDIVHGVFPRKRGKEGAADPLRMPYCSVYYEASEEKALRESGYPRFPFLVARWQVHGDDVYGHSPAMYALADIRQTRDMLIDAADMIGNITHPPLQGPDTLDPSEVSIDSGTITLIPRMENGAELRPVITTQYDVGKVMEAVRLFEEKIRRAFHYDVFLMFSESGAGTMTATEVLERRQMRLTQLGPVLERIQNELFSPLIRMVLDRCCDVGLVPLLPSEAGSLHIVYRSALSRAQEFGRAGGLRQYLELVSAMAGVNSSVLDVVDMDAMARTLASCLDVPPEVLRLQERVEEERKERARREEELSRLKLGMEFLSEAVSTAQRMDSIHLEKHSALRSVLDRMGFSLTGQPSRPLKADEAGGVDGFSSRKDGTQGASSDSSRMKGEPEGIR